MLDRFLQFIEDQTLIKPGQKVLVAVSGGVDSVVMTHLFQQAGIDFGLAHANFNLRGEESRGDQQFVEKLAQSLPVRCWSKGFQTKEYAEERGISIQMAAREIRYQWFEEVRVVEGFDLVATAHHLDDSLETILLNLSRGTGISGVRGIQPQVKTFIRPLLFATKQEVLEFAKNQELPWREDSSNQTLDYRRNQIRALIVPVLEQLNPNLRESIRSTIIRAQEAENMVNSRTQEFKRSSVRQVHRDLFIDQKSLVEAVGGLLILDELLKPLGFNFDQVQSIYGSLLKEPGKLFQSREYQVNVDRQDLIISPIVDSGSDEGFIERGDAVFHSPDLTLEMRELEAKSYQPPAQESVASLDLDQLTFPLTVRPWAPGDRFKPLGMKGQKKVSDFMIDRKIPVNLKRRLRVLVSDQKIVWLVGMRIDDRFKITPSTRKVLQVSSMPGQ